MFQSHFSYKISRMKILKFTLFIILLMPLIYLVYLYQMQDLTADPIEYILHYTGIWTVRILLLSLALTPFRNLFKQVFFLRIRRMVVLFVFFYATLHLLVYLGLDLGFRFGHLWEDIVKRPYITVGFLAWLLLVPMAITSTNGMLRRLGKKWKTLHKSIYLIAILACLHFIWLVKADLIEPLIYSGLFFALLFYRLIKYSKS